MELNANMRTRSVPPVHSATALPGVIKIPWIYVTIPTLYESDVEFDSPAEVIEFCEAICTMSEYIDEDQEGIWNEVDGWDYIVDDPSFIKEYTSTYNGTNVADSDQWIAPFETAVENEFSKMPGRYRNVTMDQVFSSNVEHYVVNGGNFVRKNPTGKPPRTSTSPDIEYVNPDIVEYDDPEAHF